MISLFLALLLPMFNLPQEAETMHTPGQLTHVTNTFRFQLATPLEHVAPLFGPEGERCWAGKHWDPRFLYPQPGRDTEGAVFTVAHGPHTSVWVTTRFDVKAGRMQYVSVIPDAVLSLIDVQLTPSASGHTEVEVTYARTALSSAMNEEVQAMGDADRYSGPDWQKAVEGCLASEKAADRARQ